MRTRPFRLSRRTLLRGAGVSLALPWLEAMTPLGRKAYAAPPKRFVVFFSPNGTITDAWASTGTETAFTLGRILKPVEAHQADLVVLDGVDNVAATKGPGDDHMRGMGCMLTGTELLPGTTMGGGGTPSGLAGGISVDQEIVAQTKPMTKFPSIELGVLAGSQGTVWGYSNYRGPDTPLPPENNPKAVFTRIFNDVAIGGDDSAALKAQADRKSVLDAIMENYRLVAPKLGTADRQKVDAHFTSISELEKRLAGGGVATAAGTGCVRPAVPTLDGKGNDNFPAIGKAQMDLLVMALACDLTRVATLQWSNSVGGTRFSWLNPPLARGHHDLSHDPDSNLDSKEQLIRINEWYAAQFAYLLAAMKQVKEENGTLLDNTLVLWCNELQRGNAHSHPDMPFLLAGRAGGRLRTGRFLQYPKAMNVPHNNLLVSILNAFDIPATTFGNKAYCTGPLANLL